MLPPFWIAAHALLRALRHRHELIRARCDAGASSIELVIIIGGLALLAITVVAWITAKVVAKAHTINLG